MKLTRLLIGLAFIIGTVDRADGQCTGRLRVDTAGIGHLPSCEVLPARNPPPHPDSGLYRIASTLILDSLQAGGPADMQHMFGLGTWAVFQRAGAPVNQDLAHGARCPAARSGSERYGYDVHAHMFEHLDRRAWILYVSKSCARPRPEGPDETLAESAAWVIEWTGTGWRLGPRFLGGR